MMIEVAPGVNWDTEAATQSEEAINWIQEEVRPNLGAQTFDQFKRPDERVYENDTVIVTEKQAYISKNGDWARKGVTYFVTLKSEE